MLSLYQYPFSPIPRARCSLCVALQLAEADVLITNVRAEGLERAGLDYDSIKEEFPHLVYGTYLSSMVLLGTYGGVVGVP